MNYIIFSITNICHSCNKIVLKLYYNLDYRGMKYMIKILVDSTCDLPDEIIKKYDIKVLPLRVLIEGKEYFDKKTIQVDEVYSAMRKDIVPKTSMPRPKDIYDAFSEYCTEGYDFIYLAFSSALSGTYSLAKSIIEEFKSQYPRLNMEVIDSKGGSTATGLIALQAARLCEKGEQDFDGIVSKVKGLVSHVEHVFTISDLNWLIKGGRLSRTSGIIGNILDIKPILDVENGSMIVIKKVRGMKKALNTMADILEERARNCKNQIIGISHADDIKTAEALMEIIKKRFGQTEFIVNKIGSVLGSHLGIGGVGIFFFNEE